MPFPLRNTPRSEQTGFAPILILLALVGILTFVWLSNFAPFKNTLFSSLFPKDSSFAATPADQPPYNWPHSFPGKLEAEDFDDGGQDKAYNDQDAANLGGAYRSNYGVDLYPTTDSGGGYMIGSIKAGEWVEYYVNVTNSGTYNIVSRVSSDGIGGTFHIEFGGWDETGPLVIPNTGSLQNFQDVIKANVYLTAGEHTMRIAFDANSTSGSLGGLNYLDFQAVSLIYPTAATVNASGYCANPSSGVIISWTADAIKYAQIAEDPSFPTWYNKYVVNFPNNTTTAPNAFTLRQTDPAVPLIFNPGQTYYIRIWDGANISPVSSFTIPNCSSPQPSASSSKPGDIDGNNKVDIFDYNLLLTNFGRTGLGIQGDVDKNGKVDIFDYNILLTNFGK